MKANKSKRNRHTGRINAAVRRILEKGHRFEDSRGVVYYSARKPAPFTSPKTIVRAPVDL